MSCRIEQNKGVLSWFSLDSVKDYFDVTNDYVVKKLCVVLLPFTVKGEDGWKRAKNYDFNSGDNPNTTVTPRNDLQAPDLYIPFMGFVTYLVLCGVVAGFSKGT